MFVVFLGNTLEENKGLSLMKVPQWCVFNRLMDAATQSWVVIRTSPNLDLITQFWDWNECGKSHTLTATTTGSKSSQEEVNNQTDLQNSVLCPPTVFCLQVLGLD